MESSVLNLCRNLENPITFSAGETIFTEGSSGHTMYVVLDGCVDIRLHNETLEVAGPGEFFGEMAMIDSSPRSATAIAKYDCTLAAIDEKQFFRLLEQTPLFVLSVMKVLVDRLRRTNAML